MFFNQISVGINDLNKFLDRRKGSDLIFLLKTNKLAKRILHFKGKESQ